MTTASHATAPTPASAPLLQRLAAGDIFWVDQKNAEAQAILRAGHAYIAATLPMRPAMSPVMITLILTEEGLAASEKQREFFGDLDSAEKSRDAQAASKATHNPDTIKFMVGTQEVTGYAEDFIEASAHVHETAPMTHHDAESIAPVHGIGPKLRQHLGGLTGHQPGRQLMTADDFHSPEEFEIYRVGADRLPLGVLPGSWEGHLLTAMAAMVADGIERHEARMAPTGGGMAAYKAHVRDQFVSENAKLIADNARLRAAEVERRAAGPIKIDAENVFDTAYDRLSKNAQTALESKADDLRKIRELEAEVARLTEATT